MEQSFIFGGLNLRGIMLTPYGRIGISWTLRQTAGRTSPRRPRNSGPSSWNETTSIGSSDTAGRAIVGIDRSGRRGSLTTCRGLPSGCGAESTPTLEHYLWVPYGLH